tara:strand:+ start:420 stop:566 length:147 start_codon:yes stop_codon:yes gene_type:complete
MSSFTDKNKSAEAPLDGPNDLQPEVKTSRIIQLEKAKAELEKVEEDED